MFGIGGSSEILEYIVVRDVVLDLELLSCGIDSSHAIVGFSDMATITPTIGSEFKAALEPAPGYFSGI